MIEDKKDGVKVAINKEEVFWEQLRNRIEEEDLRSKAALELNTHTLPFIKKKLKEIDNGNTKD